MFSVISMRSYHRYLIWVSYDGARFQSFSSNCSSCSVINFISSLVQQTFTLSSNAFKIAQSSRTDSGVHALRNAFIIHIPVVNADESKKSLLKRWNQYAQMYLGDALRVSDFHSVSPGFCTRRNVSYRKYRYRIGVAENERVHSMCAENPPLWQFAERPYMWLLPNGFDPYKAQEICRLFEGTHNMASFMKYPKRTRDAESEYVSTMRHLYHVGLSAGESRFSCTNGFDFYEFNFVSRSFLRQQIRRMMTVMINYAYGLMKKEKIQWLLDNPNPVFFHKMRLKQAPAQGLFLDEVVYDARMYMNPIPYCFHPWDKETDTFEQSVAFDTLDEGTTVLEINNYDASGSFS